MKKIVALVLLFLCFPYSLPAHLLKSSNSEIFLKLPIVDWKIKVHSNDFDQFFTNSDPNFLKDYISTRLRIAAGGEGCSLGKFSFERINEQETVSLSAQFVCPQRKGIVDIFYNLFYGDKVHQHITKIHEGSLSTTYTFSEGNTQFRISGNAFWKVFWNFLKLGLKHILLGFDHILFVLSLILGALRFRSLFWLVTSFTIAHSISLALATFDIVNVSPHVVEPAIAGSIVWVALWNLLTPMKAHTRGDIFITFFFGLVHGLGFSGVLKEAHLSHAELAIPLFAFNVGVETAQCLVIATVFPLLLYLRRFSQVLALRVERLCLAGIVLMGSYWVIQRLFFFQ